MSLENETNLAPEGELSLQLPAGSEGENLFGDIYGGWVAAKAVTAAEIFAARIAGGRLATVSIGSMAFMSPVSHGTVLSFYCQQQERGNSSLQIKTEIWGAAAGSRELHKVTEVETVQVAIDPQGNIRSLPLD